MISVSSKDFNFEVHVEFNMLFSENTENSIDCN